MNGVSNNAATCSRAGENILIVGGGLAGLLCALECKRNGFSPTVLESKPSVQSAGDFVVIGDSALRGLQRWPGLWKAFNERIWDCRQTFHRHTGELEAGPFKIAFGASIERSTLHTILMHAAEVEKIDVRCNQRVVDYFESEDNAGVVFDNGNSLTADFVVAADGIHSRSWQIVTGQEPRVFSSGSATFRTAFPVEHAMKDPLLREKWQADANGDRMAMFIGPHAHGIMCFTKTIATWVWMHNDNPKTSSESWTATLSSEDALAQLDADGDWARDFRAVVAATPPKHIVDWRLMWRDLQSEWVSPKGRVAQVGDAAHAFLPTSVNGATQALEDAVSLPTCLRLAVDKHGVGAFPSGAHVHNKLRLDRVSLVQLFGIQRRNAFRDIDWEAVKIDPKRVVAGPPAWQWKHDPVEYAQEQFEACLQCILKDEPFVNTNVQPGYVHKPWKIEDVVDKVDFAQATIGNGIPPPSE